MPIRKNTTGINHIAIGSTEITYVFKGDVQIYPSFTYSWSYNSPAPDPTCSATTSSCSNAANYAAGNSYVECTVGTSTSSDTTHGNLTCLEYPGDCIDVADNGNIWVTDCIPKADSCATVSWNYLGTYTGYTYSSAQTTGTCRTNEQECIDEDNTGLYTGTGNSQVRCATAEWQFGVMSAHTFASCVAPSGTCLSDDGCTGVNNSAWYCDSSSQSYTTCVMTPSTGGTWTSYIYDDDNNSITCSECLDEDNIGVVGGYDDFKNYCLTTTGWTFNDHWGSWGTASCSPSIPTAVCNCTRVPEKDDTDEQWTCEDDVQCVSVGWTNSPGTLYNQTACYNTGACGLSGGGDPGSCIDLGNTGDYSDCGDFENRCSSSNWNPTTMGDWTTTDCSGHTIGTCSCTVGGGTNDYNCQTQNVCYRGIWDYSAPGSWSTTACTDTGNCHTCQDALDLNFGHSCESEQRCYDAGCTWGYDHYDSWTTAACSGSLGTCGCAEVTNTDYECESRDITCDAWGWSNSAGGTYNQTSCSNTGTCTACADTNPAHTGDYCDSGDYIWECDSSTQGAQTSLTGYNYTSCTSSASCACGNTTRYNCESTSTYCAGYSWDNVAGSSYAFTSCSNTGSCGSCADDENTGDYCDSGDSSSWCTSSTASYLSTSGYDYSSCTSGSCSCGDTTMYTCESRQVCPGYSWDNSAGSTYSYTSCSNTGSCTGCADDNNTGDYCDSGDYNDVCTSSTSTYTGATGYIYTSCSGDSSCSCGESSRYTCQSTTVCVSTSSSTISSVTNLSSCSSSGSCSCGSGEANYYTCSSYQVDEGFCSKGPLYNTPILCAKAGGIWVPNEVTKYTRYYKSCTENDGTRYRRLNYTCSDNDTRYYKRGTRTCDAPYDTEYRHINYLCGDNYTTYYKRGTRTCDAPYSTRYRRRYYSCSDNDSKRYKVGTRTCIVTGTVPETRKKWSECDEGTRLEYRQTNRGCIEDYQDQWRQDNRLCTLGYTDYWKLGTRDCTEATNEPIHRRKYYDCDVATWNTKYRKTNETCDKTSQLWGRKLRSCVQLTTATWYRAENRRCDELTTRENWTKSTTTCSAWWIKRTGTCSRTEYY